MTNSDIVKIPYVYKHLLKRKTQWRETLKKFNFKILEVFKELRHTKNNTTYYQYRAKCQCKICKTICYKNNNQIFAILKGLRPACGKCNKIKKHTRERFYNKVFDSFKNYHDQIRFDVAIIKYKYFKDCPPEYDLDHKFSTYSCFINCVPVWICNAPPNLEPVLKIKNQEKHYKNSITIEELYKNFFEWIISNQDYQELIIKTQNEKTT